MSHKVMVETELLADILAKSFDPWPEVPLPERRVLIRELLQVARPDNDVIGKRIRHIQLLDHLHTRYKSQQDDFARTLIDTLSPPMDWDLLENWFEANDSALSVPQGSEL